MEKGVSLKLNWAKDPVSKYDLNFFGLDAFQGSTLALYVLVTDIMVLLLYH
jgi:hypothetical protein